MRLMKGSKETPDACAHSNNISDNVDTQADWRQCVDWGYKVRLVPASQSQRIRSMPLDFPMSDRQKAPPSGDFMRIYARVRGDIETNM